MTCANCIYHVQAWPLCTHPDSWDWSFWGDAMDYACHTPAKDVPETNFGNIREEKCPAESRRVPSQEQVLNPPKPTP